jgi:hypothetical protein
MQPPADAQQFGRKAFFWPPAVRRACPETHAADDGNLR